MKPRRISPHAVEFRARFVTPSITSTAARDLRGPWMSTRRIREQFDFSSLKAVRAWAAREHLIPIHVGRRVLFAVADVEAAIRRVSVFHANESRKGA